MADKTQIIITAKDETRAAIASAQRGLDSLAASGASLRNAFGFLGAAGGIAGLIGGAGLAATVKTAVDELDRLDEAAERVGVSVESLSALNFAGTLSGLEAEDMTMALTKLSVKMQEAASGSKEAAALFADLGVKVTDSTGKLKSADQVLAEVADAFSGFEDGASKTALAVDLFGKSGAKLVPLLNRGADGLAQMRAEAEKLGAVVDGKLAKQAADFNDNLDRLRIASSAVGRAIAADLLPWLNRLSEEFLAGITSADGFWAALSAGATVNPFKTTGENLATVRADLAKMEADIKEYGYIDEQRYNRKKTQLEYLKRLQVNEVVRDAGNNYGNEGRGLTQGKAEIKRSGAEEAKPKAAGGAARAQADEAARLIAQLNEQIALKGLDAESTDKMAAAEQQRAKVLYQLDAGTLKASAAQREKITTALDELVVLERTLQAQKEFTAAVEKQEQANVKDRQAMLEQIAAAEKAAELFGLNAAQISVVEQARLADAIAIARQNGASEEQIAVLEEELRLRGQLSDALIKGETKSQQQRDAEEAIKAVDELDQFTIQAARNMQDALSDFLFDPAADGFRGMAEGFARAVQRMLADAVAAQLLKALLGDFGSAKKTGDSGLLGGLFKSIKEGFSSSGGSSGLMPGEHDWMKDAFKGVFGLFGFADGGIMTSAGPLPLHKYAMGGVASSPQLALFGEGRTPEAYVPLPDGRNIPVKMQGAAPAQNIRIVNAFDQSVIGDYLGSAAGEKLILNAVQRNASAMRQVMA